VIKAHDSPHLSVKRLATQNPRALDAVTSAQEVVKVFGSLNHPNTPEIKAVTTPNRKASATRSTKRKGGSMGSPTELKWVLYWWLIAHS